MSSTISSDYIFHFTDSFDAVKGILINGFRLSKNKESLECLRNSISSTDFSEFGFLGEPERLAKYEQELNPELDMVCFCDILPQQATEHMQDYGHYALAFEKDWAAKNDINPVLYINTSNEAKPLIAQHLGILYKLYIDNRLNKLDAIGRPLVPNIDRQLEVLFSNIKPYMGINFKTGQPKRLYDEREWRFIPGELNSHLNNYDGRSYLKFNDSDLEFLVVASELEKQMLVEYNNTILHNKFKLLDTRIKLFSDLVD